MVRVHLLPPNNIVSYNTGLLAQLGEHRLDKAGVPGSKPGQATKINGNVAPMVEQWTENSCVAGSSPVIATKQF